MYTLHVYQDASITLQWPNIFQVTTWISHGSFGCIHTGCCIKQLACAKCYILLLVLICIIMIVFSNDLKEKVPQANKLESICAIVCLDMNQVPNQCVEMKQKQVQYPCAEHFASHGWFAKCADCRDLDARWEWFSHTCMAGSQHYSCISYVISHSYFLSLPYHWELMTKLNAAPMFTRTISFFKTGILLVSLFKIQSSPYDTRHNETRGTMTGAWWKTKNEDFVDSRGASRRSSYSCAVHDRAWLLFDKLNALNDIILPRCCWH